MLPAQCQHLERVEQTKMFMAQDMHIEHYLWGKRMVSYVPQVRRTDGKDLLVRTCMCGSAHDCGCVVNGSNTMVLSTTTGRKCPIHIYIYVHVYIHCTCTCLVWVPYVLPIWVAFLTSYIHVHVASVLFQLCIHVCTCICNWGVKQALLVM